MKVLTDKEKRFVDITSEYKDVIAKVCALYSGPGAPFDDLYQEVLANLWQGLDSFRGEAKMSTWIYRAAINTCITWHRRNDRYNSASLDSLTFEPDESGDDSAENYYTLLNLISRLGPVDKALITLWLDEKPYEEIALITSISTANVAVRLHRIKSKLGKMAADMEE
ncbi:MAG: sigma-70 family RNA polymerase sigma factor [Muribaculaceae bacterium]|nr:sigma-70 family RNA polymerase sigma factor [Muribaculaceae bacterium]